MATSGHTATDYRGMSGGMSGRTRMRGMRTNGSGRSGSMPWGALAAGLAAGLAVTYGRKFMVEAMSASAGDWYDSLKAEHAAVMAKFDKLEQTRDDQTTQRMMLLTAIKHSLAKHSYAEETTVYPELRLHAQKEQADHLNHDHFEIKTYLYELLNMPKDDPRWMERVRELRALVAEHAREEEEEIYPPLRQRMTKEQNAKITTLLHKEGFALA